MQRTIKKLICNGGLDVETEFELRPICKPLRKEKKRKVTN